MIPLVLASGAGANASKSIGISVVSGMLISTVLSVFVVPALYMIVRSIEERFKRPQTSNDDGVGSLEVREVPGRELQ
jgi:hydrophobic/amphiphilic exporter-1 (mainly G- bacteria), HAE1 family